MPTPVLLAEKITFCDRGCGLDAMVRSALLEKISRFAEQHDELNRLSIELMRDDTFPEAPLVAKGQLELRGPGLFASVAAATPTDAVDVLLNKFARQLRRHRPAKSAHKGPQAEAATLMLPGAVRA